MPPALRTSVQLLLYVSPLFQRYSPTAAATTASRPPVFALRATASLLESEDDDEDDDELPDPEATAKPVGMLVSEAEAEALAGEAAVELAAAEVATFVGWVEVLPYWLAAAQFCCLLCWLV